jgi:hypothetical protein
VAACFHFTSPVCSNSSQSEPGKNPEVQSRVGPEPCEHAFVLPGGEGELLVHVHGAGIPRLGGAKGERRCEEAKQASQPTATGDTLHIRLIL